MGLILVEFYHPENIEQFEELLEDFKLRSKNSSNNDTIFPNNTYGDKIGKDRLIFCMTFWV